MNKMLITYASHSGSTQEVARYIGDELSAQGLSVDVKPVSAITDVSAYEVIIAGGMLYRFGLHPDAINFLKLLLMLLTGVKARDYRNLEAIKEWVNGLGLKEKK